MMCTLFDWSKLVACVDLGCDILFTGMPSGIV